MPELAEDIARRVAQNEARSVPAEGQTGYYLGVTGQSPFRYAFLQPPDDEIPRFAGSPDGVLGAPIDSLVRNTDDHTVWINTDGDTAWSQIGSGDAELIFAKQMYGNENDPGGAAPVSPWGGAFGGLFSPSIDDPSVDDSGWLDVGLWSDVEGNPEVSLTRGVDAAVSFGYIDESIRTNVDRDESRLYSDWEAYTSGGSAAVGRNVNLDAYDDFFGGGPVAQFQDDVFLEETSTNATGHFENIGSVGEDNAFWQATWEADDGGGNTSRVIIGTGAPQGSDVNPFIKIERNALQAWLGVCDGDPNGIYNAPKGSVLFDCTTPNIWQNTDGVTAWTAH